MGDRQWKESAEDIVATLKHLRTLVEVSPDVLRMEPEFGREWAKVQRRLELLTYAASRSIDPAHVAWERSIRERRDNGTLAQRPQGNRYTAEELRQRARVS